LVLGQAGPPALCCLGNFLTGPRACEGPKLPRGIRGRGTLGAPGRQGGGPAREDALFGCQFFGRSPPEPPPPHHGIHGIVFFFWHRNSISKLVAKLGGQKKKTVFLFLQGGGGQSVTCPPQRGRGRWAPTGFCIAGGIKRAAGIKENRRPRAQRHSRRGLVLPRFRLPSIFGRGGGPAVVFCPHQRNPVCADLGGEIELFCYLGIGSHPARRGPRMGFRAGGPDSPERACPGWLGVNCPTTRSDGALVFWPPRGGGDATIPGNPGAVVRAVPANGAGTWWQWDPRGARETACYLAARAPEFTFGIPGRSTTARNLQRPANKLGAPLGPSGLALGTSFRGSPPR